MKTVSHKKLVWVVESVEKEIEKETKETKKIKQKEKTKNAKNSKKAALVRKSIREYKQHSEQLLISAVLMWYVKH